MIGTSPEFLDGCVHLLEIDCVDLESSADVVWERDAQFTAEVLLEFAESFENAALALGVAQVVGIGPEGEAALSEASIDPFELLGGEPSVLMGVDGVEEHTGCDGLPMGDGEVCEQLDLVCGPVPEVEGTSGSVFEGVSVGADVIEMEFGASRDEALHGGEVAGWVAWGGFAEFVEERLVADDGDFECFSDSAEPISVGEWQEEIEVVDDGERGRERSDGIFAEEVHGVLDPDTCIILGEDGGGNPDETQTAVDQCSGEADGIENGSSSDCEDEGLAIHPKLEQLGEGLFDEAEIVF